MKSNRWLGLILLQSMIIAACTGGSSDQVSSHEQRPDEEIRMTSPAAASAATKSAGSSVISETEQTFLDFKNWENLAVSESAEFKSFINTFEKKAIDNFSNINKNSYTTLFLQFCDAELSNCKHLRILKSSPYSAILLAKLAAEESDLNIRMRLTILSLESSNQIPNEAASLQLLKDLKSIRQELVKSNKLTLLHQVETYAQLIYTNAHSKILKISDEMLGSTLDLLQTGEETQLEMAGRLYIKEGKPTSVISDRISKLNANPSSYVKKMEWLEKNAPHFVTQLKVKKLETDAYFFVLEQVLQRNWTSKQAAAFFKGTGLYLKTLNEIAKIYASNTVAYIIAAIQADLFAGYKNDSDKNKERFFYAAGVAIGPRLVEARSIVDQFKALLSLEDILGGVKNSGLRRITESLPETFRLAVTDAVTLSLINHGLKINVDPKARFPILGSNLSEYINLVYIFLKTISGQQDPLIYVLPTAASNNNFSFYEALEFAVRANFFGPNPEDADEALTRLIEFYTQIDAYHPTGYVPPGAEQTRVSILERSAVRFRNLKVNPFYNYTLSQCQLIDKQGIGGTLNINSLEQSPTLGKGIWDFKGTSTTSTTTGNSSGSTSRVNYAIFPANSSDTDSLEWGRLDLIPRIEQMFAVTKAIEANTNLRFPKFTKAANTIKSLYAEVYIAQTEQLRDFLPCWYKIMNEDRRIIAEIVKYDYQFWQWALRPENQSKMPEIFSKDLPGAMKYRSQFKGNSIVIYNYDLLIRARYYMTYGLPFLGSPLPPIAPRMKINITEGLIKESLYRNSYMSVVDISSNHEDTAKNAVRASGFKSNTSVNWFNASYMPSVFSGLTEVTSAIYRMGPMAKEFLGVASIFAIDELFKANFDIFTFLNLQDSESAALDILGEDKRYKSYGQSESPYLYDENGEYVTSVTEYLTKKLISQWGSSFGDASRWENPKDNSGLSRPSSLIPLLEVAKSHKNFTEESQSNLAHLFKDNLSSTKGISYYINKSIWLDIEAREATIEKFKSTPDFTIGIKLNEKAKVDGYNNFLVNDLKSHLEELKKHLPK